MRSAARCRGGRGIAAAPVPSKSRAAVRINVDMEAPGDTPSPLPLAPLGERGEVLRLEGAVHRRLIAKNDLAVALELGKDGAQVSGKPFRPLRVARCIGRRERPAEQSVLVKRLF